MKRNLFKALFVIAVLAALVSVLAVTAYADDRTVTDSGTCGANGDNLTWTLYSDGELVICGTGEMADWSSPSNVPWYDIRSNITKVTVSSGVTSIGDYAFCDCTNLTSIDIPESITSIGNSAFAYSTKLTSIEIPASVKSIGSNAFSNCTNLTSINIPASVTSIGSYSFSDCSKLTSVEIPSNVTSIGQGAFYGCAALKAIKVAAGNTVYVDVDGVLFTKDMKTIVSYPNGKSESIYKIPEDVTIISDYAFRSCTNLTSIEIPEGVTSINSFAFCGCSNLTNVKLPHGVTSIEARAFSGCTNLTSIEIPEGVTSIGSYAFEYCKNLTSIELPESVTSIGNSAFNGCSKLASITVFTKTAKFGSGVFQNCNADFTIYGYAGSTAETYASENDHAFVELAVVERTVIASGKCGAEGDNLTWTLYSDAELIISGTGAMSERWTLSSPWYPYRSKIAKLTILNGVTRIGDYAFYGCNLITSIDIPESVTSIGDYAFTACESLSKIEIPKGVTIIDGYAFSLCSNLTNVELSASVTSIADTSFHGCDALLAINVAESSSSYTDIDGILFTKDKKTLVKYPVGQTQTSYKIPEGVTSIGYEAFASCTNLTSIELPEGVTSIGSDAFYWCTNLTSIELPDSVTSIGYGAFADCHNLASVEMSESVIRIDFGAFQDCKSLTRIELPASLTTFGSITGSGVFEGCIALTSIEVNESNNVYVDVDGVLFTKDLKTIVAYPAGKTETTFKLPDGVTSIFRSAFNGCLSLASVEIPASVTIIDSYAFKDCSNLISVEIPEGVTKIDDWTFGGCSNLTRIKLPSTVTSIDYAAFSECKSLASIELPAGLTYIGEYAFKSCESLTSIELSASVTSIDKKAFYNCSKLASIEIPESVTRIGNEAFRYCHDLVSVTVLSKNAEFGSNVFQNCLDALTIYGYKGSTAQTYATANGHNFVALTERTVIDSGECGTSGDNVTWTIYSDGELVISGNGAMADYDGYLSTPWYNYRSDITRVAIENGVTSIGEFAFCRFSNLTSTELPISVTSIANLAFAGCEKLTNVEITDSVSHIGSGAFSDCTNLTAFAVVDGNESYTDADGVLFTKDMKTMVSYPAGKEGTSYKIPISVTNIGDYAFSCCDELISIELPEGVRNIGLYAFENCSALRTIDLPAKIANIGNYAFSSCAALRSIEIPESVISIGDNMFEYCDALANIKISERVTSIGSFVFFSCDALASINIPASVTSIGGGAFAGCRNLTRVTVLSKTATFNTYVFQSVNADFKIYGYSGSTAEAYATANGHNFVALAERTVIASGECGASGDNVTWTIYSDGELVISGTGKMANWSVSGNYAPWYPHRSNVTIINIQDGITRIGNASFYLFKGIENVTIPSSVKALGSNAFCSSSIKSINLPEGLETLESLVFQSCSSLAEINLPSTVKSIGIGAFYRCTKLSSLNVHQNNTSYVVSNGVLYSYDMTTLHTYLRSNNAASFTVPSSVNKISGYAFSYNTSLESIVLGAGITDIGKVSFKYCRNLTSVTIYSKNPSFGENVFDNTSSSLTIYGETGSTVQDYALQNSHSFVEIEIPYMMVASGNCGTAESNVQWAFYNDGSLVISGNGDMCDCIPEAPWSAYVTAITSVTIENGVTRIGKYAFEDCSAVTSIEIADSVTSIGDSAFDYCSTLKSIKLPSGLTDICDYLFYHCESLTSVDIPTGVQSIGDYAFYYCTSLQSIKIPDSVRIIGKNAFHNCGALTNIVLPKGLTTICDEAFRYCESLERIEIPASVTSIGSGIIQYCGSLTEIIVADGNITYVDVNGVLFEKDMRSLIAYPAAKTETSYKIPDSVTCIYEYAFVNCDNLVDIVFPERANFIGGSAFYGCSNLSAVTIPEGVTNIYYQTFGLCTSLKSVVLPESLTSICKLSFVNCHALTSIQIPKNVTTIESYSFYRCSTLTKAKIPDSVTNIGSLAFDGCSADLAIYGNEGSAAHTFASSAGYKFVVLPSFEPKFLSASLSLYNDISVNFKANKEVMDAAGYTAPYAVFEFGGKTYTVSDYTVEMMLVSGVETEVYVFAFKNLAPDRMNDTITATLHASFEGEDYASNSVSYSVAKYCYNQLKKCTEKTALATVCVDLLNYGSATQEYTGYRTDALANADLTDEQKSWGTQDDREFKNVTARDNAPAVESAAWKSASLKLRENITVEMKFEAADITGLYVEVEMYGHTYRIDEFGYDETYGWYVVEFDKFSALHMSEVIKATVRDADGNAVSKVLTYSVESYAASKQGTDALGELVKAMMKYGDAAIAYAKSLN